MDISALRDREVSAPLSVTELNDFIKKLFDTNRTLSAISVTGEISNFTDHRSGHLYFSLKDSDAQIKAVMFRTQRMKLKFVPEEGMKVTVHGSVSIYSQTGAVQLYVNSMEPDGIGALYLAYEQLKERLSAEGLFDDENKKEIPSFPNKIGVITSPTGAAVRDIINVAGRRFPLAQIFLYPSLVQGDGAEDNLIRALDYFEASKLVDVIIIGRGGGSIEDLWAFNGERLARKIYNCSIPLISAVGHETDFTICDFVADLRAPTPSAAAEIAVPDIREIALRVDDIETRLTSLLERIAERKREKLDMIISSDVFVNPSAIFNSRREEVADVYKNLTVAFDNRLSNLKNSLALLAGKAEAMSPLSVLKRGYSICENGDGTAVAKTNELKVGENVKIVLSDGVASAQITDLKRGKNYEK